MGCNSSQELPKDTFFSENQVHILKEHFSRLFENSQFPEKLFGVRGAEELHTQMMGFLNRRMKDQTDFKGFLKALELLIYGHCKAGSETLLELERLSIVEGVTATSCDFAETLGKLSLAMVQADPSLLSLLKPNVRTLAQLQAFYHSQFPVLEHAFPNFLRKKLFGGTLPSMPVIEHGDKLISLTLPALYISCPSMGQELHCLYLSTKDGLSLNRLVSGIYGYPGPMILLLRLAEDSIIGAYIGDELKDNAEYGGSMDTFLFSFTEKFKAFRAQGEGGGNFVYLNSKITGSQKYPAGLGFGGRTPNRARLWLDTEIESNSYVCSHDNTFEEGFLCKDQRRMVNLNIMSIEIWGCGEEKALKCQKKARIMEQQRITNFRKVDKSMLVDSDFNKEYLMGKTFQNKEYRTEK